VLCNDTARHCIRLTIRISLQDRSSWKPD
jgi:hypothetical protein